MKNKNFWMWCLLVGIVGVCALYPDLALAQVGGGTLETKMKSLASGLISVVLPGLSILGLIYAAGLAVSGDGNAKSKITAIIFTSAVGFLAPVIIGWLKSIMT